jgi:hypothetical protein
MTNHAATLPAPYALDFDDCDHERQFDRDSWTGDCAFCGARADSAHVEYDADEDGICGSTLIVEWFAPADDDPRLPVLQDN